MTHDFHECLARSHAADELPLWREVYEKAFPSMLSMVNHRADGDWQKAGIDRSIVLASSKVLRVDEKIRGRCAATGLVYDDILLEHTSNNVRDTPGWVCKPLLADFIAYAIAPLGRCYLLPVEQLQAAWRERGETWKHEYRKVEARNVGYATLCTPVPVSVLFAAIGRALRFAFTPREFNEKP